MTIKILVLSVLIFFTSCSSTFQSYYHTLNLAFSNQSELQPTFTEVDKSDVDLILLKYGDRPNVIMALAYIESEQYKWVSRDNAMLVTENGRIVRTLGLEEDLLFISNLKNDPLQNFTLRTKNSKNIKPWHRIIDLSSDTYGVHVFSSFDSIANKKLNVFKKGINSHHLIETVNSENSKNNGWENHYWFAKNGQLIKSSQKLSPSSKNITVTYLSRIARLQNQATDQ